MSDTKEKAAASNQASFINGEKANVHISGGNFYLQAGGTTTISSGTDGGTQLDELIKEKKGKVTEPKSDDKDLTWLSNGKFALYKKRPLNKAVRTVFYGRQRVPPDYWREVAIKVIRYKKSLDELVLLMRLRHPNIVQIIDAGELKAIDYIYIVMELCPRNLRTYVEKHSFDFQKSLSFVQQIVAGLCYLHDNNVTHRDLKPDNILISPCKKVVKLSDFGLSVEIPVGQSAATVTAIGVGTAGYRAPETYQDIHRVAPSIDIFPFGLITYYTFTHGKHPFGSHPYEVAVNIMKNQNRDLSQIPPFDESNGRNRDHLIDLLCQTLQHDPSKRPTIKEIEESAFISGQSSSAKDLCAQGGSVSPTVSGSQWQSRQLQSSSEPANDDTVSQNLKAIQLPHLTEDLDQIKSDAESGIANEEEIYRGLEPIKITQTTEGFDKPTNSTNTQQSTETAAKNAESPDNGALVASSLKKSKGILTSIKSLFKSNSNRHEIAPSHRSESKREKRIREIQEELKNPLKEIGLPRSFNLLLELRRLRGFDDLDSLLQMAEYELQLGRGKEEDSIRQVRDFISSSEWGNAMYTKELADRCCKNKCYIRALILCQISNDLYFSPYVNPDDAVRWISHCAGFATYASRPLIEAEAKLCDIGIKYGLEFVEKLLDDLRAIKIASPDVKALNEATCLTNIACMCITVAFYQKSIQYGNEAVSILENTIAADASTDGLYGRTLNNLGIAYAYSGQFSEAKRCYTRAIEVMQKVVNRENDTEMREAIEVSKRALAHIY